MIKNLIGDNEARDEAIGRVLDKFTAPLDRTGFTYHGFADALARSEDNPRSISGLIALGVPGYRVRTGASCWGEAW